MTYPIIEQPVYPKLTATIFDGVTTYDLGAYLVTASGSNGLTPDEYFATLEPGLCTVVLRDITSTIEALLTPGRYVEVGNVVPTSGTYYALWEGKLRDVKTDFEYDDIEQRLVPVTTFTATNAVAEIANITIPERTFLDYTLGEKMSLDTFASKFEDATGIITGVWSGGSSVYVNQFTAEMNALDVLNMAARSTNMLLKTKITASTISVDFVPLVTPTNAYLATDGTHTSSAGLDVLEYHSIDYGYDSNTFLSEVDFNNVGLNRAAKTSNDPGVYDIPVSYSKTQSIGFTNKVGLDTCLATDNLGWNLIPNTGSSSVSPANYWLSSNYSFGVNSETYNGHPTVGARCSTAHSVVVSIYMLPLDTEYDFVTSTPGGATGSWTFSFKAKGTTSSISMLARIIWYNAAGTLLRTDSGTASSISTSTYTTLSVTAASAPTGAVTAIASVVVNQAVSLGYRFFITEGMFTRNSTGTTFFDGATTDTTSYLYTWTGQEGASPSQKNTNTLDTLGSTILARNVVEKRATSVTFNCQQSYGINNFISAFTSGISPTADYNGWQVCVNGVTSNYRAVGVDWEITPTSFIGTVKLALV